MSLLFVVLFAFCFGAIGGFVIGRRDRRRSNGFGSGMSRPSRAHVWPELYDR
jgi:hypothetical protein